MKKHLPVAPLALALLLGTTVAAMAHPPQYHATIGGAAQAGFLHPFTGLDHLLVMIAVGLWAVQIGGRACWLLPTAFVGSMIIGGTIALSGIHLAVVESGILASIVLLSAALGMAWRPPLWSAALLIGAAGLCHGYAHGSEMAAGLIPSLFFVGMVIATSLLHGFGVTLGIALQRHRLQFATRIAGAALLAFAIYDCFYPVA